MSEHVDVPMRVQKDSNNIIQNMEEWKKIHAESIDNSDLFWLDITRKDIAWEEKPTIGLEGGFDNIADEMFKWFSNGRLNATISCLDQHLANRGDKVAILWEGETWYTWTSAPAGTMEVASTISPPTTLTMSASTVVVACTFILETADVCID